MPGTDSDNADVVYIGLGSNISDPYAQIKKAITALDDLPGTNVVKDSGYYTSRPMGPEDQPDYVNAVVEVETALNAYELLDRCQSIEQQQGRVRKRHWGERTIDLDILLYAGAVVDSPDLTIPHPGICQRDFVYIPLLKLNPELELPGKGKLHNIVKSVLGNKTDFACQFVGNIE